MGSCSDSMQVHLKPFAIAGLTFLTVSASQLVTSHPSCWYGAAQMQDRPGHAQAATHPHTVTAHQFFAPTRTPMPCKPHCRPLAVSSWPVTRNKPEGAQRRAQPQVKRLRPPICSMPVSVPLMASLTSTRAYFLKRGQLLPATSLHACAVRALQPKHYALHVRTVLRNSSKYFVLDA